MFASSSFESVAGRGLNETLFSLFGIKRFLDQDLPVGAVSLVGRGVDTGSACWAQVTPVHLLADMDRILLFRINPKDISNKKAEHYVELFNEYFKSYSLRLLMYEKDEWYLRLQKCPNLSTSDIESVAGKCIFDYLPAGKDGKKWRSFLNEVQMLFHQNSIDSDQPVSGDNRINGVWFSGVGCIPVARAEYSSVYSNHPILTGLATLSDISHYSVPQSLDDVLLPNGDTLVLIESLMDRVMDADIEGWISELCELDKITGQLLNTNRKTKSKEIFVYSCDGTKFKLKKTEHRIKLWSIRKIFRELLD